MLVTITPGTPHSWWQKRLYITWKLDENVAYYEEQKCQNPGFLTKYAFFGERKMTVLAAKSFGA